MPPARPLLSALALLLLAPHAVAQDASGVRVALDPEFVSMPAAGAARVTVVLQNLLGHEVTLLLVAEPPEGSGLDATLERAEVRVAPGASERVGLQVNASATTAAGTHRVAVHAREANASQGGADATALLAVGVSEDGPPPPLLFTLQLDPLRVQALHGETRVVTMRLQNLRDAPGAFSMMLAAPHGLVVDAPEVIGLAARETRDVPLRVAVQPDAPLGPAQVNLSVRDALSSHSNAAIAASFVVDVTLPPPSGPAPEGRLRATPEGLAGGAAGLLVVGAVAAGAWWVWRRGGALPALAPLYTRIARGRVLEHPTRAAIADLVRAEPGVTFGDVQRRLGLAAGQLTHHARVLEEGGVLFSTPDGQRRRLFHVQHGRVAPVPPLAERALAHLRREGPMRPSDLARALGVSRQALHHHVKGLAAGGLVRLDADGRLVPGP